MDFDKLAIYFSYRLRDVNPHMLLRVTFHLSRWKVSYDTTNFEKSLEERFRELHTIHNGIVQSTGPLLFCEHNVFKGRRGPYPLDGNYVERVARYTLPRHKANLKIRAPDQTYVAKKSRRHVALSQ